jgi:hypothetical protein
MEEIGSMLEHVLTSVKRSGSVNLSGDISFREPQHPRETARAEEMESGGAARRRDTIGVDSHPSQSGFCSDHAHLLCNT